MRFVSVSDLTVRFPVYGVENRSLKKHLARLTLGNTMAAGKVGGPIEGSWNGARIVTALQGVSLELQEGDRLGLVGPNGAGKTTLLRCLAGAYEPDQGRVEVHGRIASLLDLSMGIDPSSTGYQNIRLRGLLAGLTNAEIEEKTAGIAEFTQLGSYLQLPVKTYSAGMSARLAFAVATSIDADVLLLDEWLAVGDAGFQQQAHDRLVSLVNRANILVFASHSPAMIRSFCNKVMRIDSGRASPVVDVAELDTLMAA